MTKVIVTGAFGNVGSNAVMEMQAKGFDITAVDLNNERTEKQYQRLQNYGEFNVEWIDLTNQDAVGNLIHTVQPNAIVHIAAIIPPLAYTNPKLARKVNVDATQYLIEGASKLDTNPKFVYTSSYSVHGPFSPREETSPITADTPVNPKDNYAKHKVECEKMLQDSDLNWTILRLSGVYNHLPAEGASDPTLFKFMFTLPYERKSHGTDSRDVGLALANTVERDVVHKTYVIGGDDSWKGTGGDMVNNMMEISGLGHLPEEAFRNPDPSKKEDWYYEYWIDPTVPQKDLQYQRYSYSQFLEDAKNAAGYKRYLIKMISPLAKRSLLKHSPFMETEGYDEGTAWEWVVKLFEIDESKV